MRSPDGCLLPDSILQKRYKIINIVHTGTVSRTYKGIDIKYNKYVFIKEVITEYKDPSLRYQAIEQFKGEAKILFQLKHENLPEFKDYFDYDNNRYIVIEYIEGERLNTFIERQKNFLSEAEILNMTLQLCNVLSYLHNIKPNPVIFRDLNPQSIIITEKGILKLIDFGISKIYEFDVRTRGIAKTMTRHYSPVEQHSGSTDTRSDIYSLGATIYYLTTREVPADSIDRTLDDEKIKSCRDINPYISSGFEKIITKAMELLKENRYQNIEKMKDDLIRQSEMKSMNYERKVKDGNKGSYDNSSGNSFRIKLPPKNLYKSQKKITDEEKIDIKKFRPRELTPSLEVSSKLKDMKSVNKKIKDTEKIPLIESEKLIKNRYKIIDLIKTGPLSRIYKGIDLANNNVIVIKQLVFDKYLKPAEKMKTIEQLHTETEVMLSLSHPNLPAFEDYFTYEDNNYLIMEYIEGRSLKSIIENNGRSPWNIVIKWTCQICDVLNYLHTRKPRPIIFRGLSPENILIEPSNDIKLIDFGISKLYAPDERTLSIAKVANTNFSPPEQYTGKTDTRSDIYSLGATLYYVVTRNLPEDSVDRVMSNMPLGPANFPASMPSELEEINFKYTKIDKKRRYEHIQKIK